MAKAQKTLPHGGDVSAFIASVPNRVRREDAFSLMDLMRRVTGDKPVMWGTSIVGFGSYAYPYAGGGEGIALRIGFSPRSNRLVLYLPLRRKGVRARLTRLGPHESSVSCLYLKTLADIDLGVLEEIIAASFDKEQGANVPFAARKRTAAKAAVKKSRAKPAVKKKTAKRPVKKASKKGRKRG